MSIKVDELHRRQQQYANLSAETGQSEDLTVGAGLEMSTKTVQETAGARAVSERLSQYLNLMESRNAPGVPVGQTGSPSLDEPASELNVQRNLESLLLMLKIETDEDQAETRAAMMEESEAAIKNKTDALISQINDTMEEMAKASKTQDIIKAIGWAVTAISVLATAVTLGASIAAVAAANAATVATTAAATTTTTVATATTATATTATATATTATVASVTSSATTSTFAQMGFNIGKAALSSTVKKTVAKEVAKEAVKRTAEEVSKEVAKRLAETSAKEVAKAAVKASLRRCVATSAAVGFQVLNENDVTTEWSKGISDWFGDEDGVSGTVIMGALQMGVSIGAGYYAGNAALNATKGMGTVNTAKVVSGCVLSGVGLAQSGATIYNSHVQRDANLSEVKTTELRVTLARMRQMIEEQQEELSEIIANIQNTLSDAFAIIDHQNQATKKISENMANMA